MIFFENLISTFCVSDKRQNSSTLRFLRNSVIAKYFKIKSIRFTIKSIALKFYSNIPNNHKQLLQALLIYGSTCWKHREKPRLLHFQINFSYQFNYYLFSPLFLYCFSSYCLSPIL